MTILGKMAGSCLVKAPAALAVVQSLLSSTFAIGVNDSCLGLPMLCSQGSQNFWPYWKMSPGKHASC